MAQQHPPAHSLTLNEDDSLKHEDSSSSSDGEGSQGPSAIDGGDALPLNSDCSHLNRGDGNGGTASGGGADEKKAVRRLKNRESARRARARRLNLLQDLQEQVNMFSKEKDELFFTVTKLQQDKAAAGKQLADLQTENKDLELENMLLRRQVAVLEKACFAGMTPSQTGNFQERQNERPPLPVKSEVPDGAKQPAHRPSQFQGLQGHRTTPQASPVLRPVNGDYPMHSSRFHDNEPFRNGLQDVMGEQEPRVMGGYGRVSDEGANRPAKVRVVERPSSIKSDIDQHGLHRQQQNMMSAPQARFQSNVSAPQPRFQSNDPGMFSYHVQRGPVYTGIDGMVQQNQVSNRMERGRRPPGSADMPAHDPLMMGLPGLIDSGL